MKKVDGMNECEKEKKKVRKALKCPI